MSNRIYPREELQKALDKYNSQDHKFGTIHGYVKQPLTDCSVDISSISHKVNKVWLDDDGFLVCDIEILDTPYGDILKEIWNETEPFPVIIGVIAEDNKTIDSIDEMTIHMKNKEQHNQECV